MARVGCGCNTGGSSADIRGEEPGDGPGRHGGRAPVSGYVEPKDIAATGEVRGLRCYIYRPVVGDCSNGGLSSRVDTVTLVGEGVEEVSRPTEFAPEVRLRSILGALSVYPAEDPAQDRTGWMFGGCFVWTSAGRFPSRAPIALHDRCESPELARALHV